MTTIEHFYFNLTVCLATGVPASQVVVDIAIAAQYISKCMLSAFEYNSLKYVERSS